MSTKAEISIAGPMIATPYSSLVNSEVVNRKPKDGYVNEDVDNIFVLEKP